MALQKIITLADGNTATYIRFVGIDLPTVMRDAASGIGDCTVYFDVYRDEAAYKTEHRSPSTQLQITFPGAGIAGIPLSTDLNLVAKAIYELKALFPEVADATDLIDE
jgi:hypothetical protein